MLGSACRALEGWARRFPMFPTRAGFGPPFLNRQVLACGTSLTPDYSVCRRGCTLIPPLLIVRDTQAGPIYTEPGSELWDDPPTQRGARGGVPSLIPITKHQLACVWPALTSPTRPTIATGLTRGCRGDYHWTAGRLLTDVLRASGPQRRDPDHLGRLLAAQWHTSARTTQTIAQ